MNKFTGAFALSCMAAAVVVSGAAQAQSSVTLYGLVDVSMRHESDVLAGKSRLSETSGMLNTSRWGLRGTEDVGGGVAVNFQLEVGVSPDTGTQAESASLFDRKATVGISGAWGKLDVGRNSTFGWEYTPVYDPLGGALATPAPTSHSSGKAALLVNGFMFVTNNPYNNTKLRDNNVKYVYTGAGGFVAGVDYSFGETAGSGAKKSGRQAMLGYMKNDVNVVAAYDELRDAANLRQKVITVGGNYRVAPAFKATLAYSRLTADAAFAPASNAVTGALSNYSAPFGVTAGGDIKFQVTGAGLEYTVFPAMTLTGALYNTRVTGSGIAGNDYRTYALLAKYALSKRTTLYAALDHEHATTNGGLATVSGKATNSGATLGVQLRY